MGKRVKAVLSAALLILGAVAPAAKADSNLIRMGMFTNDTAWDFQDRWQTGSLQISHYGLFENRPAWEFRIHGSIMSPESLHAPKPANDRPYAAALELGVFRYEQYDNHTFSAGAKLILHGKYAGLPLLQSGIHELIGFNTFSYEDLDYKIDDGVTWGTEFEWIQENNTDFGYVLPFARVEIGPRDRVTAGVDVIITQTKRLILSREHVTGNLIHRIWERDYRNYISFLLGADVTYVADDYYLDASHSNVRSQPWRYRLRPAVKVERGGVQIHIGPTYLSPDFIGQREGQLVQTISIDYDF